MTASTKRRSLTTQLLALSLLCFIALLTLTFRSQQLDLRPMHHDEANQAVRAGRLLETGHYAYDPIDHHGPSLYYLSLPLARLTANGDFAQTRETTYRLLPVLFSVATLLLLGLLWDGLGWAATLVAGLFTALSPVMFYYSRFFIQESIFLFCIVATIVCLWRWSSSRHIVWVILAGISLGFMHATKETCIIAMACIVMAWFVARPDRHGKDKAKQLWQGLLLVAVALAVSVVFYSSFFTNWRGVGLSFTPYLAYIQKAYTPRFHDHPASYYLQMLFWTRNGAGPLWTEAMLLILGLIGGISGFLRESLQARGNVRLIRFVAVYTLLSTVIYSGIAYKTPWNILPFMIGIIILAAVGAVWLWDRAGGLWLKGGLAVLLLCGSVHLGRQCYLGNFRYHSDPRNPYAYVQTSTDYLRLVQRIERVSALDPAGRDLMITVASDPYAVWPLPWSLRAYTQVGYWTDASELPLSAKPPLIVASSEIQEELAASLEEDYLTEYYGLRQDVMMVLNIRKDLWQAFLETRQAVRAFP